MMKPQTLERLMHQKRLARVRAIEKLHRAALAEGGPDDPGYWALVHDLEQAAITTNLAQLAEIGVETPDPRTLDDAEVSRVLGDVVRGLGALDVFLLRTDHLDDRALYEVLHGRILREEVRDVPAGCGSREWIDLGGGGDRETWLAWYADDDERDMAAADGEVLPARRERRADRDRSLPRPDDVREIIGDVC